MMKDHGAWVQILPVRKWQIQNSTVLHELSFVKGERSTIKMINCDMTQDNGYAGMGTC